jgi:hypothetical protein
MKYDKLQASHCIRCICACITEQCSGNTKNVLTSLMNIPKEGGVAQMTTAQRTPAYYVKCTRVYLQTRAFNCLNLQLAQPILTNHMPLILAPKQCCQIDRSIWELGLKAYDLSKCVGQVEG